MKVLLPIEDAESAHWAVEAVVRQFKPSADVRVLQVVEWPKNLPMFLAMGEGPSAGEDLLGSRDRAFREAEVLARDVARELHQAGFNAHAMVQGGTARDTILECAREWQPDVIVMGSHGRTGLDRVLLGSVSDAVVRRAHCSVEVVRPANGAAA